MTAPASPPRTAGRGARRLVPVALGIVVSGGLLYLSFRAVDFADVGDRIAGVSIGILALSLPVRAVGFALAAVRSHLLFRPLHPYGAMRLLKSVLLAFAVNNVVPFRAGELARVGYLARYGPLPASTCLAVIAVERLVDLFVLMVLFLGVIPAMAASMPVGATFYVVLGAVAVAFGAAWFVNRHPDPFVRFCASCARGMGRSLSAFVERQARTFADGLVALSSLGALAGVVLLTTAFWLLTALSMQIWLWAFGLDAPWYTPAAVLGFLTLGLAVPSTPGHIGTYHFFTIAALTTVGVAEAPATSFAVVAHAMAVIPFTVLAVPLLFRDLVQWRRDAVQNQPPS